MLLTSLRLEGFRAWKTLEVPDLARVNLLVGPNNSGKTSVLEAVELLLRAGAPNSLYNVASRRGEVIFPQVSPGEPLQMDAAIAHIFHGHSLESGAKFKICSGGSRWIACEISSNQPAVASQARFPPPRDGGSGLYLHCTDDGGTNLWAALSRHNGLPFSPAAWASAPVRFVGARELIDEALAGLWGRVLLTPEEEEVNAAARIIEPRLERIAPVPSPTARESTFVKLQGTDRPVPLGTLGEGVRTMVYIALNLVNVANGHLLVDEIERGLHYSVMEKMWRMVVETARRLDVQVFATTHSHDCLMALARLLESSPDLGSEIAVHRLDRGAEKSIHLDAKDVVVAAKHDLELRGWA